ncbi:starch synthase 3, chloroplastic/amyloplastic [Rhododendron vialii]|uniref:starch synthase 3, chloroplastic/amyloplastic n=1 Tax=Rhododendron vialii TaxID=182163 RepID=UPI00265ED9D5|nr:starch synthase 3, chloroplastic/amyloplastic [Rhododendron vialii]XP_058200426.1 starch synthase 3, chloroplastic/amyloplastic [Rhododendron vialii]
MEVPLHVQRPICCRTVFFTEGTHFKPFIGVFPRGKTNLYSQYSSWQKDFPVAGVSRRVTASADFSRRQQPRKKMNSGAKGSGPKGFVPKTPVGTSTQKRDQRSSGETAGSSTSTSSDYGGSANKTVEMNVDTDKERIVGAHPLKKVEEEREDKIDRTHKGGSDRNPRAAEKLNQVAENRVVRTINDFTAKSQKLKTIAKNVEDSVDRTGSGGTTVDNAKSEVVRQNANIDSDESKKTIASVKNESVDFRQTERIISREKENDDSSSLKLKLEMEENMLKQKLERLAEEKFSKGIKMFHYPEVVKPNQDIEVFLNRSLSTLNNEPDVMIMGAFNDWRWKSFTEKLNKTHFKGDWWSCQLHVPKEGYKIDFVFFNGKDVYDNNETKDFCITVEGGLSVFEFEDFLLEEKRRELEKLAKEQGERERQAEEQRKIEAEKAASEADRAQARGEVQKKREILQELTKKAVRFVDNVWHIEPSEFKGGDMVRLYYNKSSGPLAHAKDLWIHGGQDNWNDGLSIVARLVSSDREDGDWWYVDVLVPERAHVLDWVFADGPPQQAVVYDNNHCQDFHAIVPKSIPEELFWVDEEDKIYRKLQEERRLREEAIRAKAERTARMKAEMKERTLKTFLLSQKHIVYTEPLNIQAGNMVTVFYNPANTVLNGKSEIWFRCSFNRWTHRMGPLPPQKMLPVENSSHVKVTVKVPLDAYVMDFVFSEREDGGIFDNNSGMDYHIPVSGGVVQESPMHIVHIAVEMAPIAKVGGLGDVVTSLSRAVQDLNHNVNIIFPKYDCMNLSNVKDFHFQKSYSWGGTEIKVWFGKVEGLSVYFLEPQNGLFWTGCIYGCKNDAERFGFFCHSALEFLLQSGFHPDIIHCHDWSSAPVAWLFKEHYMHYGLSRARAVFTIHNLEFGAQFIGKAITYADKATTVSHTYSKEVSGNPVIAPHLYKFHGILNGIDHDIWDPYNDRYIPVSYTADNVVEGKRASKQALQQRLGLKTADLPLVGIITRLTHQKGIHLIKHAIWQTLDRNGQVVLLGSAPDPRIQNDFVNLANHLHSSHGDRARLCLTYDEPLSHLIYAGADFIIVPSIFEPCGLTQLIAMRYGSIPVVRKTGGLHDTVFDVDHDKERAEAQGLEPNGFSFDGADAAGIEYALNRAISAWYDSRDWFNSLCKRVMEQDWSWNRPALDYMELYHSARK